MRRRHPPAAAHAFEKAETHCQGDLIRLMLTHRLPATVDVQPWAARGFLISYQSSAVAYQSPRMRATWRWWVGHVLGAVRPVLQAQAQDQQRQRLREDL